MGDFLVRSILVACSDGNTGVGVPDSLETAKEGGYRVWGDVKFELYHHPFVITQNHVVIVNRSGVLYRDLIVTLETIDGQRPVLHKGLFSENLLRVVNWPNAFYGEWVEVTEAGVRSA